MQQYYLPALRRCGLICIALVLAGCGAAASPTTSAPSASAEIAQAATTVASPTLAPTTTPTLVPTTAPTLAPTYAATSTPLPSPTAAATVVASPSSSAASGSATQATIKLFMFKPAMLDVKVGTTVVWTNEDAIQHSVTSGTPSAPDGTFNSDFFTQGQTFSFTFTTPGMYQYFCMRHESMTGMIHVAS
jgi:plastocyanin